ncbi:hypothetical protein [Zwartia vadi]|uniref:hypothetical protein n=1 Tax=Zwartia vadi TaxID=3058168 RepID=UPI0025B32545|nr:hypothetical protein [Zwartia vadi]MDN3987231.1 hypothetical protein [Zwartia vadi]
MNDRRVILPARQARIEFLRTRAAYEREALSFHTAQLGREVSPKRWLGKLWHSGRDDQLGSHSGIAGLLGQGLSLASQYPYIAASLSSLLLGKRWRWVKWLGAGFAVWQAVSSSRSKDPDTETEPSDSR